MCALDQGRRLRELRQLRQGAPDTEAMTLYSDILDLAIVVDAFHFKNHSEDDTFCQKETNPTLDSIPVGLDSERMVEPAAVAAGV